VRAAIGAVEQFVGMFTQMGGLMAERVTDLQDIRDRVLAELSGLAEPGVPLPDAPSILCAEDLAPADTAGLDPALILALATTLGGPLAFLYIGAGVVEHRQAAGPDHWRVLHARDDGDPMQNSARRGAGGVIGCGR